jgi:hypothetical protein
MQGVVPSLPQKACDNLQRPNRCQTSTAFGASDRLFLSYYLVNNPAPP